MPQNSYFLFGDIAANCLVAILAALCCSWLIDSSWSMLVAMLIAMPLGMLIAMVLALGVLMRFFGAMEVMLPTMQSGMWAGMIVGMRSAMGPLPTIDAILYGALIGVVVVGLCWAFNSRLRGSAYHNEEATS